MDLARETRKEGTRLIFTLVPLRHSVNGCASCLLLLTVCLANTPSLFLISFHPIAPGLQSPWPELHTTTTSRILLFFGQNPLAAGLVGLFCLRIPTILLKQHNRRLAWLKFIDRNLQASQAIP